ncbi:MAG TPA: hypothetical protein VNX88_21445 [Terriglobales bacterium]|jgi:hypothetical protein|nr:hypothetical protein [Terriglobales bacterium]
MEVSIRPDEEQKETPAKSANGDVMPKNKNAAASGDRESGERTRAVRKDPGAAQKLARKKRLKAAHRRRLKASHAKG